MSVWSNRHASVRHFETLFAYNHLPPQLREVSRPFGELAETLLGLLPDDSPEVSAGLRKLVEAKDCAVRAAVATVFKADPDLGGSVKTPAEILKDAGHEPPRGIL